MTSWEERMAAKSKARQVVAEAEDITRKEAEQAESRAELDAAFPAVRGEGDVVVALDGPFREHHGHRTHAHFGIGTKCSCGAILGLATFAVEADTLPLPPCPVCVARGIA